MDGQLTVPSSAWADTELLSKRGYFSGVLRPLMAQIASGGSIDVHLPDSAFWSREVYRRAGAIAHGLFGAGGYSLRRTGGYCTVSRVLPGAGSAQ